MAAQSLDPGCTFKVDCASVQFGAQRDRTCATVPGRTLARVWGPVAERLACDREQVIWMLAHKTTSDPDGNRVSNGQPHRASDVIGNDLVDELAKQGAGADALP